MTSNGGDIADTPGRRIPKRATIHDVARLAGVSIATVSKSLNDRGGVSADTRASVVRAAAQLSFRPSPLARGLLSDRTGTVGLITNDLDGRFSIPMLIGAEDALGPERISVFLCDARGDAIREAHYVNSLLDRQVDGILVVADTADPRPPLAVRCPVPVVYAYGPSTGAQDISVVTDDAQSGLLAARHLLHTGRRRIVYLGGDPAYAASTERSTGARAALHEAGLDFAVPAVFGSWSESWGRQGIRILLERAPELDGVLCGSDQIARGVLDGLVRSGRSVPGDVAVIGHDNSRRVAEDASPALTTVDMDLQRLGWTAARLLFESQTSPDNGASLGRRHVIAPQLIVRNSTVIG